jgi:tripartite-type tricarboxylate transporter receptor subunit TctC
MTPAHITRRRTLRTLAATAIWTALGLSTGGSVWAQTAVWPTPGKPIRIVLPFPAGSGTDGNVRHIAKQLQDQLGGHPVIVDNKPGAGTFIGAVDVARAAPDGHTLLYTIVITHTQNPHLYAKLPYDPFKDFTPLTQVMKSATVLVTQASAPYNTVAELVAYAKAHPGKLNYASFSTGSTSHLNGELLKLRTGIDIVHVPYKGTPDATRALLAGEVQLYFDGTTTAIAQMKAGKVKALGAATPTRVPVLPDVPTIAEQGVPGLDIVGWQALFGPGNMAPELAARVAGALRQVVTAPDFVRFVEQQGAQPSGASGAEFAAIVKSDHDRWGEVIRAAKIKLD